MDSRFVLSLLFVLLFATPLWATDPTKWDPNKMQIGSPVVRNWSWDYSDLQKAAGKWLDTQSEADGVECDRLADKLLADYKGRVKTYVIVSELANLRGNKDKAIELIRLAPEKFTSYDDTVDTRMPLPLFIHFHIAAYAKQAGDLVTAREEYEKILEEIHRIPTDAKQRGGYAVEAAICHLYIAEIDVAKTGKTDALSQRIKLIKELTPPVIPDEERQLFPDSDTPFEMIVKWADYQLVKKTQGAEASRSKCKQPDELVDLFMESHFVSNGLDGGMLVGNEKAIDILTQRMMNNSKSEFDKGSIPLWRGGLYEYQKKYTEAEKYYNILLQEESFLSPSGGAGLVRCKKLQGKNEEAEVLRNQLKQKYPSINFKDKPKTEMKAF